MFSSQPNLFSRSQRSQDVYPTDGAGDFSQLQNANCTQFELFSENSQDSSQLFFSQNEEMSAPNSETYRQVPVYEKYIAKPSLFGARGRGRPVNSNRTNNKSTAFNNSSQIIKLPGQMAQQNSFQQIASQKAKAKERDERDLLGSIVKMVKECADEVKCSLTTFKETDAGKILDMQSSVKMLVSSFEQSSNKILTAVDSREDFLGKIHSLERDLQKKDEEIRVLKDQKSSNNTNESCTLLLDKMRSFLCDQQSHMDKKLQHVLDTTQEQLKLVKDMSQTKKLGQEESSKNLQDLKYSNQRQLHDIEKRLIDEIVQIRDDLDRQKRDVENFYRNQMQSYHQKQTRDLEQCLKKGVETALHESEFITTQDMKDSENEIIVKNQYQHKQMENQIKTTTKQQSEFLLKQCQQSLKKHQSLLEKSLKDSFDSLTHQQNEFIEQSQTTLKEIQVAGKMAWGNDNVPKHVQDRLNALHNQHQSEIKRLEAEIKTQREKSEVSSEVQKAVTYGSGHTSNVYDSTLGTAHVNPSGPLFEKSSGFLSPKPLPGTRWNSRRLFGRSNPSPVATVLPQRMPISSTGKGLHESQISNVPIERPQERTTLRSQTVQHREPEQMPAIEADQNSHELDKEADEAVNRLVSNQGGSRKRKQSGGRKRRAKKGKQTKRSSSIEKSTSISSAAMKRYNEREVLKKTQAERNKQALKRVSTRKSSVYDFCDDESISKNCQFVKQADALQQHTQQSSTSSQTFSDDSAESSPSLSVTEVLITRRVHNGKMDNRDLASQMSGNGARNHGNTSGDFFSSPNMLEMFNPRDSNSSIVNHQGQVQIPRMKERRKLCDFDTQHTQVFQMIQCLQKNKY